MAPISRRRTPPIAAQTFAPVADAWLREADDQRRLYRAFGLAVAAHLIVFAFQFPAASSLEPVQVEDPRVYVIQQQRFRPPPLPEETPPPQPEARTVPIPDPDPQAPELPPRLKALVAPLDDLPIDDLVFVPPPAPPAPEPAPAPPPDPGPLMVGGEVKAPVKISGPDPVYTEVARRARVQGVVIVRATIDREGRVTDVEVLRGLQLGLTEAAVDAFRRWRFSPGTLHGEAVPVLYNLSIHFGIQ